MDLSHHHQIDVPSVEQADILKCQVAHLLTEEHPLSTNVYSFVIK
jgi:hypothetical protein